MIIASQLLIFHSYFRWVVLGMMILQFGWIGINCKRNTKFTNTDFNYLVFFTFIFNIQFVLGWLLYSYSFIVDGFWQNIALGIKNRQMRFFGLEHMFMMTTAIILSNITTFRAYKRKDKTDVFKFLLKSYIWIYIIILSSIPWSFSPLTSRPNFR